MANSEYVYLSALSRLFHTIVKMKQNNQFTEEQWKTLVPCLDEVNDILNVELDVLEKENNKVN